MTLGRKEISVLLLAVGALLFFMVFMLSVSSDAQTGGGSTGAVTTGASRQATPAQNNQQNQGAQAKSSGAQAQAGNGASAQSSRDRQRRNVVRDTVPRRPLPPTGGLPVSVTVGGFVLTGASLLGVGLVIRRGPRR